MSASPRVYCLGNMGFLFDAPGGGVLVDALNEDHLTQYASLPQELETAIQRGEPPYDTVKLMLVTHAHPDHFDPVKVAAYARAHPDVPVVSCPEAILAVHRSVPRANNLVALTPSPLDAVKFSASGIGLSAVSLLHSGKANRDVRNLAFILHADLPLIHTGDAEPGPDNLEALARFGGRKGLLAVPFPFLSIRTAFDQLARLLCPEYVLAGHLPPLEKDRWGWIAATRRALGERLGQGFAVTLAAPPGQLCRWGQD